MCLHSASLTHRQQKGETNGQTDREREGEAAPTHWQIDMHSAVVGALLLFEVRNAPPKQDTHTYAHWHIKQSCLPASLLLIICKYVHAHMYISMYVHGTYGSPDIVAIAIYTYIHIQLNAWRTHIHTHTHARLGTTNDIRTKFAIIHNARQSKAVRDRRSSSSRDTSHIHLRTHSRHTSTRIYARMHTHTCETWAAASPSSLYHNLRERLKSLWGVVKYKEKRKKWKKKFV